VVQPVEANRVSSIVGAYNDATAETVRKIVDWTVAEVAAAHPAGQ